MSSRKHRGVRAAVAVVSTALASLALASNAMADKPVTPGGMFVIGDQNAQIGAQVTFWGAQWWQDNTLSGGSAPASFKGYSDTPVTCGQTWSTAPGDSSFPPPSLDGVVWAIVSSQISQNGPVISGDTQEVVVIQTDPGYASDPGHFGTGTVIGVICGGGPTGLPS